MMREPWFWRSDTPAARAVAWCASPLSLLYDAAQRARWRATTPSASPAPVICVGNATLGGVGKTPFIVMLHRLLSNEGVAAHFLTRGYGGAEKGPLIVRPDTHSVSNVGDEALLLARHGTVWVARDRAAGAKAAAAAGANAILMDDGFQNPTIVKTVSVLLIDAADPAGNGRVFPAGPLREPLARARNRARALIAVGPTPEASEAAARPFDTPFAAWLEPADAPAPTRVIAFSGIGVPEKFFATLKRAGFEIARALSFPDHYAYRKHDLDALKRLSKELGAPLITTEKDHVRLPARFAETVKVLPVIMRMNDADALKEVIIGAIANFDAAHG